jgi:hypothetical protein
VQCARLDVHELGREGKLKLGTRGLLFGTIRFEVAGGPDAQRLVLEYPRRSASGELLDPLQQIIGCHWRKAHFGGCYLLFTCTECSARVLYAPYGNDRIWFFSCRRCAGITYQSTMGHRWDRSARRIEKLRAQLKWRGAEPIKPRGMHQRTYRRILEELTYHEGIRRQGASYARKCNSNQHRVSPESVARQQIHHAARDIAGRGKLGHLVFDVPNLARDFVSHVVFVFNAECSLSRSTLLVFFIPRGLNAAISAVCLSAFSAASTSLRMGSICRCATRTSSGSPRHSCVGRNRFSSHVLGSLGPKSSHSGPSFGNFLLCSAAKSFACFQPVTPLEALIPQGIEAAGRNPARN